MAEVYVIPGVERRDLAGEPVPCERLFEAALEAGIVDAIVVGRDRAGQLYVASAGTDADRDVGLLMRAVQFLTSMEFEHHAPIETEPPTAG